MEANELNHLLIERFPELREKFIEETSWQEEYDTGSTVVFEDVFMPYVLETLEQGNKSKIERVFSFIEELSNIDDYYVNNVIRLSVIDNFKYYDKSLDYEKWLGEKSRYFYDLK